MDKIDEIEQIITMGYGNPRERAEQILALLDVNQQRELLNDFVRQYNASTEKFEGISEDSVDCYFRGIL